MPKLRMALIIAAGVLAALVAGWLYGWSGTRPLHRDLAATRLRLLLVESRMKILDARVDIYSANFGNASQNLEHAKPPLEQARTALQGDGRSELAAQLDTALQRTTEAQQLASKFNQDANSRAGEAGRLIAEVLQAAAAP